MDFENYRQSVMRWHTNLWEDLPDNYRQWVLSGVLPDAVGAVQSAMNCDIKASLSQILRYERAITNLRSALPLERQIPVGEILDRVDEATMLAMVEALADNCKCKFTNKGDT